MRSQLGFCQVRPCRIRHCRVASLALIVGLSLISQVQAEMPKTLESPEGSLVIIGGSLRYDDPEVWTQIVELAGGAGARIAVFPTASGDPVKTGERLIETLSKYGAHAFLVPLGVKNIEQDPKQVVFDSNIVAQVRTAGGVFFCGGSQARITGTLYTDSGENTPLLNAVWDVYRRGGVIAGTSAGAAIMSNVMFASPPSNVLRTLQKCPLEWGKDLDRGLGFLDRNWFVDQHLLVRGRFARTIAAMQQQDLKLGVGVDENTAMVIREGRHLSIAGYRGAVVVDLSDASRDAELQTFNVKNARLSYLDRGDKFDLKARTLTPSDKKLSEQKVDPRSPDFKPFYKEPLFFNDVLGNTTVADVMAKLIESQHDEAIGLAFDGRQARQQQTPGFEFRFYRQDDSVGWYSFANGCDDYTVANIHLDVRPIEIQGPLYK